MKRVKGVLLRVCWGASQAHVGSPAGVAAGCSIGHQRRQLVAHNSARLRKTKSVVNRMALSFTRRFSSREVVSSVGGRAHGMRSFLHATPRPPVEAAEQECSTKVLPKRHGKEESKKNVQ